LEGLTRSVISSHIQKWRQRLHAESEKARVDFQGKLQGNTQVTLDQQQFLLHLGQRQHQQQQLQLMQAMQQQQFVPTQAVKRGYTIVSNQFSLQRGQEAATTPATLASETNVQYNEGCFSNITDSKRRKTNNIAVDNYDDNNNNNYYNLDADKENHQGARGAAAAEVGVVEENDEAANKRSNKDWNVDSIMQSPLEEEMTRIMFSEVLDF